MIHFIVIFICIALLLAFIIAYQCIFKHFEFNYTKLLYILTATCDRG